MTRLSRPHIPLYVRELALDHQMRAAGFGTSWASQQGRSVAVRLRLKLEEFFGGVPVELHHRPALLNREIIRRKDGSLGYLPDANNPDYLVYLTAEDHDIETHVRGQHGQYSDLAMARKRKRKERKAKRPKRKWPSRSFPKRKCT
jgi:hypothetical protein